MNAARSVPQRLHFIDAIKAIASQLIVLHHLAFYGPMSDYARTLSPGLFSWLSQHARIAVQAFLVIGGFLAAQALACDGRLTDKPLGQILWRRYLKLAIPYFFALALAIAAAGIARSLITHESIPPAPTLAQVVAHMLLLQSILGFDGLSAGVWYIAIDFQLYALLLIVFWLARRIFPAAENAGLVCVITLIAASLFHFNRNPAWDNWAIYFVGAYGLGAIAYWGTRRNHVAWWALLAVAMAATALIMDFRSRILLALIVATALGLSRTVGFIATWPHSRILGWLGQISYSVFLVHFPVCLVINAVFERFQAHTPNIELAGILTAWFASIGAGAVMHRYVERRSQPAASSAK